MGVHTNPDISATCTVTADGGILPLYFINPEGQIKRVTGNSVKQQRQAISGTNNSVTNHNNNNSNNVTNNNITNHIHVHMPDELHKAIHEMRSEDIVQCRMNIAHQTIDELKG